MIIKNCDCGNSDVVVRPSGNKKFVAVCRTCGKTTIETKTIEDAIKRWNELVIPITRLK